MISKMEIWLKCGKDSIQLPILPASYNVTRDAGHETVNVQNLGDVTILGKRGGCKKTPLTEKSPRP